MAEVIPNFTTKYDIDDLLKLVYPRQILIVSADSDKYSQDAKQIYQSVKKEIGKPNPEKNYHCKEFQGGHKLDQQRFEYIINWFVNKFKERKASP